MAKESTINEMLEIEVNLTQGDLVYMDMFNRYIELYDRIKKDWEEVQQEDLWEDGELKLDEVFDKINYHLFHKGDWKLVKEKEMIKFTCCECEHHYENGITGDTDERTCYKCLEKGEKDG